MAPNRTRRIRRGKLVVAAAALAVLGTSCSDDVADPEPPDPAPEEEAEVPAAIMELPDIEGPLAEGDMYLDPLEANLSPGDLAQERGYTFDDYVVSGESAGEPYRVRVQVARPDAAEPSGHALVEAIHPQGIAFVWNFTRDLLMEEGHAAVNVSVFPNTVAMLQSADEARYGDLHVSDDGGDIAFEHVSGIYAQVGAWLKSEASPLPELQWLHLTGHSMSVGPVWQFMDTHHGEHVSGIYAQVGAWLKSEASPLPELQWLHLTGHSMSVGPVWQFMDTHHGEHRLEGGAPVYDGFFPETTRTASRMGPFPEVDVPTVLVNSELEVEQVLVEEGIDYRRPDSDEAGTQFRLYEVAGMPHNLSWRHPLLEMIGVGEAAAERCANPLNDFPYNETVSMALDHLLRWVAEDVPPPRAEPIQLTGEPGVDAAVARDEHGNARGGVRTTPLDVPVATHLGLNEAVDEDEDEDVSPGSCLVYGSQIDFTAEQLQDLYGDHATYVDQVAERVAELVEEGWVLEHHVADLVRRAEAVDFARR